MCRNVAVLKKDSATAPRISVWYKMWDDKTEQGGRGKEYFAKYMKFLRFFDLSYWFGVSAKCMCPFRPHFYRYCDNSNKTLLGEPCRHESHPLRLSADLLFISLFCFPVFKVWETCKINSQELYSSKNKDGHVNSLKSKLCGFGQGGISWVTEILVGRVREH